MQTLPQSSNPGSVHVSENEATPGESHVASIRENAAMSPESSPNTEKIKAVPVRPGLTSPKPNNATAPEKSLWTILKDVVTFMFQFVAVIAALVFGAWAIKSYDVQLTANDLASQSLQYAATSNQYAVQAQQDTDSSNENANQLALLSAQLSLLTYCEAYGDSTNNQAICDAVAAAVPLANLASALSIPLPLPSPTLPSSGNPSAIPTASEPLFSSQPTTSSPPISSPTSTPVAGGDASSPPSTDLSIGAIIGIVTGAVAITVALITAGIGYRTRRTRRFTRSSFASAHAADGDMSI
ncbi:hypothetical protein MMC27_004963 [Xylographa pallens]|nr:hypothetical protein [Xylographa pallens]